MLESKQCKVKSCTFAHHPMQLDFASTELITTNLENAMKVNKASTDKIKPNWVP
jgi:hypothetical protein